MHPLTFTAHVIKGSGRGKDLGTPTLNLDLSEMPSNFKEGIYACFAVIDGTRHKGAMHYGPRPVFKDVPSCEVHLLETTLGNTPDTLTVEVIGHLRPVMDFASSADLQAQMARDIAQSRAILEAHDSDV